MYGHMTTTVYHCLYTRGCPTYPVTQLNLPSPIQITTLQKRPQPLEGCSPDSLPAEGSSTDLIGGSPEVWARWNRVYQ